MKVQFEFSFEIIAVKIPHSSDHGTIHCKCKLKCWLNKEFENKLSHNITDKWRLDRNKNYFYYWMKREFYCDIKQASKQFCKVWTFNG